MKQIFKNRNFITLWAAQIIEQIGDSFTLMALIAWAMSLRVDGSAAGNMSMLMFWIGLPILTLGPVAGVFVDRFKKRNIMAVAALFRGALIFIIYLLIADKARGAYVYLLVFSISVVSQFFIPAKSALIPHLVDDKDLIDANSLSATSAILVQILTYAGAGVVIAAIGPQKAMFINSIIYAGVFVTVLFISPCEGNITVPKNELKVVWSDFVHGLKFLLTNEKVFFVARRVFLLMIAAGFFYIALTGNFIDTIIHNSRIRIKDIKALGFMQAFLAIGLVAGMFIVKSLLKWVREEILIRVIFPILGALVITLYFIPDFFYLLFVSVAAGTGAVMIISIAETMIQKNTPEKLRGRIFSTYYILRGTGLAAATSLTGVLAKFVREDHIVLYSGIALFAYGVLTLWRRLPEK
jgi:MFS family permease